MSEKMALAFKPYEQYIRLLAVGKLDGYLDKLDRDSKLSVPGIVLSTDPNLLLHDLGRYVDMERIKQLFSGGTVYLFGILTYISVVDIHFFRHQYNKSGSGKSRHSLNGLCHRWGCYISCRDGNSPKTGGSLDFDYAVAKLLPFLRAWNAKDPNNAQQNANSTDRVFTMLIWARIFILKQLMDQFPPSTDPLSARRRWVLLQAMPPHQPFHETEDIFVEILQTLRLGDMDIMQKLIRSTLLTFLNEKRNLFPDDKFFIVLDEAQDAAKRHVDCFPSVSRPGSVTGSALHEKYRFLTGLGIFSGIIVSGTGLSKEIVQSSFSSISAKEQKPIYVSKIVTDTGDFLDGTSQESYIRRYITISDDNASDQRLLYRIQFWLKGRCVCCG
jgi:hypothetical protein